MTHPSRAAMVLFGGMIAVRPSGAQAPATPAPVPAAGPVTSAAFVLAVDEGETLLPIARYAGGRWLNTWPEPEPDATPVPALTKVPAAWLGGAVPVDWTLWPTGGGSTRVTITGTARTGGCVVSPKLTVPERRFPPAGAYDQVHPGLATSQGGNVRGIDMVSGRSMTSSVAAKALVDRIQPVVVSLFAAHQGQALAKAVASHGGTVSLTPQRLAAVPVAIEWLYRESGADAGVLYFEANKRAAPTATQRLTVRGWLRIDASGAVTPLDIEAHVAFDDSPPSDDPIANVSDQIPLGVIHVGRDAVWVMEVPAGETTTFMLREVGLTSVRTVLQIDAGGC